MNTAIQSPPKRGMTRKRLAEIQAISQANMHVGAGLVSSEAAIERSVALREVLRWIDSEGGLMDFDPPDLGPAIFQGDGDYWVTDESGFRRVREVVGCNDIFCFAVGLHFNRQDGSHVRKGSPAKVHGKVVYRDRCLTPEEATRFLGRRVASSGQSITGEIKYVGEGIVVIAGDDGREYPRNYISLAQLYRTEDGGKLAITEPVPFTG